MKEATGEGSMTIITIIIIVALAAAAAVVVGVMVSKAGNEADKATGDQKIKICPTGQKVDVTTGNCVSITS